MQRAIDGKGSLAAPIAETCLTPNAGLSEAELSLTFDIVRILIKSVETKVRRHLAAYLAERDDVPDDLVSFLVNDEISVAYSMLVHSRMLQDDALINIISNRTKQHRLAITVRPDVSEAVCEALIEAGEPDVIESLLFNNNATVKPDTLDAIVATSQKIDVFHLPLVHRRDLTADQAKRLFTWVGDALRDHILSHFDLDPETIRQATDVAVSSALVDTDPWIDGETNPAARLHAALQNGDRHSVEIRFADCTDLDPATAIKILYGRSARALAVACKASGLSVVTFGKLILHGRGGAQYGGFEQSEIYRQAVAYFERLGDASAKKTLETWKNTPSSIWRRDKS